MAKTVGAVDAIARLDLVRELVFSDFLQPGQAIVPIKIFDECPHDRSPLYEGRLGPVCFGDAS